MDLPSTYLPMDRCQAMAQGAALPDRTTGAALFADASGFTALTEALAKELGPKRGAEELTRQLNAIFEALIDEVHRYGGSVITFAGDAITIWFDGDDGRRATACGLAMQVAMRQFGPVPLPSGGSIVLAVKAAVAHGPVRRFQAGNARIQWLDVLAGATLDRMAATEKHATRGEVVLHADTCVQLGALVQVAEWRHAAPPDTAPLGAGTEFAVISGLTAPVAPCPWPAPAPLPEDQVRPWLLPTIYARLRSGAAEFLAEIRPTVTLFLTFTGLDYDRDEAAGDKLNVYIRYAQDVIHRYEGALLQVIMGDKGSYLYATFGAPLAHDDDDLRAVAAALELRAPPPEAATVREIGIGISRGRIWSGAFGSSTRHTYGVLGDAVNLAARLMGKAEPGQILITQEIADNTTSNYQHRSLGRLTVKGRSEPLPVFQVLGPCQTLPAPLALGARPVVGRDPELAQMRELLDRALRGEGQILRLEGREGVGKTHLAAALVADATAQGFRVYQGLGQSITRNIAYAPWRQIFPALLGLDTPPAGATAGWQMAHVEAAISRLNPDWRIRLPLLGDLLGLPILDNATTAAFDPRLRQQALFALVVELVLAYAREQPLLFILEDAHWMDEASQGLTLALARVLARAPVLLVLIHRPAAQPDQRLLPYLNRLAYCRTLTLSELAPEAMAVLTTHWLQGPVAATALSLVQTQAQGNPFFAEALVEALREAGYLAQAPGGAWDLVDSLVEALRAANLLEKDPAGEGWRLVADAQLSAVALDIPDSIQGAVLSRLDRLPEENKLTLKVASVIGRLFELAVLARAHPGGAAPDQFQTQFRTFEQQGLTHLETPPPQTAYEFTHNITQEVLYATLLETQQHLLHRAVGLALEGLRPEAVEQLAYHFGRAEMSDKALLYLDRAAAKAQRSYANETALYYYTQALALEARWPWRKGQIEVLHILGRREEERAALQALEALPDAPAYERAHLWGRYYEAVSDYAQAQAQVERALALARAQADHLSEANCLGQLGLIARRQGDYDGAKAWYQQALALFPETADDQAAQVLVQTLNGLGLVYRQQGNLDEARAHDQRALLLSRQTGNKRGEAEALSGLGVTAFYERDFARATAYHTEALAQRRSIGDRAGEGVSLTNLALAAHTSGSYGEAEKYYTLALDIQQAIGNRWEEINISNSLGVLYQELGAWARAQACLRRGLELSREIGDEAGQAYLLANLGLIAREQGQLEPAEAILKEGLGLARQQDDKNLMAYFASYLGGVNLRAGKPAEAVEWAQTALALREQHNMRLFMADDLATLASACLAQGQPAQALEHAQASLAILEECGGQGPEFPQLDYYSLYQVFLAAGQREAALKALGAAHRLMLSFAGKITEAPLRQSFMENVAINQQILAAAQAQGLSA